MSDGKRPKLRVRKTRPIGQLKDSPPSKNHPVPEPRDGAWFLPEPISNRLHQKSALGVPVSGGVLLNAEEIMFCHWNRHVPLPSGWVDERIAEDSNFVYKSVVFDVVREGGDKVVPIDGGNGAVSPTSKTINDGSYSPLSRPIFIYVNPEAAKRPEVDAFVTFYLENAASLAGEVGYVGMPDSVNDRVKARYENKEVGGWFK